MPADPFAAYVAKDDPFAQFATKREPVDGGPETYEGGFWKTAGNDALETAKGVGEGIFAPVLHPIDTAMGIGHVLNSSPRELATEAVPYLKRGAQIAQGTLNGIAGIVTGDAALQKNSLDTALDPRSGGQAVGALLGSKLLPEALPRVVKGLRRIGPAVSSGSEVAWAGAKGAAENLPFVSAPVKGAIRGMRSALDERAIAAIDNPANVARGQQAVQSSRGVPTAQAAGFDPYMANTSAAPSAGGDVAASVSADVPRVPQGTFTKLPDDSWGISGSNLTPGEPVHVMSRSGSGRMMTIDQILNDIEGKQTATIRPAGSSAPPSSSDPLAWSSEMVDTGDGSTVSAAEAAKRGVPSTPSPNTGTLSEQRAFRDTQQARHDAAFNKATGAWNTGAGPTLTASERELLRQMDRQGPPSAPPMPTGLNMDMSPIEKMLRDSLSARSHR